MKLSVSQYNQYKRCPYSWKLSRVDKAWQRPAAWLPQGSAVHEAAEMYEKSGRTMTLDEAQDVFRESYAREVEKYTEKTPNFNFWSRSGPYAGEADIERRYGIGLEQVEKYISWYDKHPEEVIWIAEDGTPGIEIGFDIDLDGVLIRGFIDAVIQEESKVVVRDNKTGNKPGDDFQLAVYSVALQEQYGVHVPTGDYWMGRTGKPTMPYDLTGWTRERVRDEFKELQRAIEAEEFEPDPEQSKCMFCDVSYACEFKV